MYFCIIDLIKERFNYFVFIFFFFQFSFQLFRVAPTVIIGIGRVGFGFVTGASRSTKQIIKKTVELSLPLD